MNEQIRIYLADDHQIVLDGLILLLKDEPGILLCGSATDGEKAWEELQQCKPDIALLDLRMPGRDGLQLLRLLKHELGGKCVILSMHSDKRYVTDAMNYGADGYLLKNTGRAELLACIRQVMAGEKVFPTLKPERDTQESLFLSPRELDVLKLVLNEYTSQQIADKLSLSPYTVDTHRKNILRKTGARNLAGLVKYAMEQGMDFQE